MVVHFKATWDNLVTWAEKWQMDFNVQKCKVMHVGITEEEV